MPETPMNSKDGQPCPRCGQGVITKRSMCVTRKAIVPPGRTYEVARDVLCGVCDYCRSTFVPSFDHQRLIDDLCCEIRRDPANRSSWRSGPLPEDRFKIIPRRCAKCGVYAVITTTEKRQRVILYHGQLMYVEYVDADVRACLSCDFRTYGSDDGPVLKALLQNAVTCTHDRPGERRELVWTPREDRQGLVARSSFASCTGPLEYSVESRVSEKCSEFLLWVSPLLIPPSTQVFPTQEEAMAQAQKCEDWMTQRFV